MFDRRNPLTPADLKKKRKEIEAHKKYQETHKPDEVYAFGILEGEKRVYIYCGVTNNIPKRFADHKAGIANKLDFKGAYVGARELQEAGETIHFWELGPTGEYTENDFIEALRADGHPLLNEATGTQKRKKSLTDVAKAMAKLTPTQKANVKKANAGLTLKKATK